MVDFIMGTSGKCQPLKSRATVRGQEHIDTTWRRFRKALELRRVRALLLYSELLCSPCRFDGGGRGCQNCPFRLSQWDSIQLAKVPKTDRQHFLQDSQTIHGQRAHGGNPVPSLPSRERCGAVDLFPCFSGQSLRIAAHPACYHHPFSFPYIL